MKKGTRGKGSDPFKCHMKRSFETKEEALKEMKCLKIFKEYKKLKRAYICDLCGKWHLTKKVKNG